MSFFVGLLFLVYYLAICFYVGRWNSTFSRFWMLCGIGLICCYEWKAWIPFSAIRIMGGLALFFLAVVAFLCMRMIFFGKQEIPGELSYLIVLGARVDHTRITCSLRLRLERAYEYAVQQHDVMIVVSGGQGRGEDISEARAMADYLIDRGIEPERVILEEHSASTRENLRFTARMLPDVKEKKTGLVTNSFHIYRSCLIGKREGYRRLFPVPAKSEKILFVNYVVREILAILLLTAKGWINRH